MLDVRLAFVTANEATCAMHELQVLDDLAETRELKESERLRHAELERMRDAVIHPQTHEAIFAPLRLSTVVPMNMILDAVMLSAWTPMQTIFAQWLNQSYNALHYHANRNTTNEESFSQRVMAYLAATASSVGVALFLTSGRFPQLRKFAPFCAVAAADTFNLSIMRKSEFLRGIDVFDAASGDHVGTSRRAGLMATGSCIVARVAAAFPILVGSPLIMDALEGPIARHAPFLRVPVMLCTVGLMIQLAVPVTFGLFHQQMTVSTSLLEPTLHTRAERVFFNKGL
ncbi:Sideroflexin [Hondaea fermentalgiana]|uniref:Sideroflexin n=1 Tax=Hondaea fermentalgiana TaxID=2315210 RepID=A0A2R5GS61_9STRA|nr:Sideroflexin [Hondaea fermentalgiana]|eukprot:GBG31483.1 Sideroflexin [Hondaea fermentalgiana]